jgi:hypothetical protein
MKSRGVNNTKSRYKELRDVVYEFTENEFKVPGLKLSEITLQDAINADLWSEKWNDSERITTWEWRNMYNEYQSNSGLKRFDLAFKVHGQICALCYGIPTRTKMVLKIHALERKPDNNPLQGKALTMILFAADAYANLLGAKELWICNPMNPTLVSKYQGVGFQPHNNKLGRTSHLTLRIK